MIYCGYECDECERKLAGEPELSVKSVKQLRTGRGGILLPRREWHFCTTKCAATFLAKQELRPDFSFNDVGPCPQFMLPQ